MRKTDPETRQFYRKLSSLALPIALQSLMLAAVAAGDALMLGRIAQAEMTAVLVESAAAAMQISRQMEDGRIPEATADSVSTQLAWLLYRGFPRAVPFAAMRHYRRYLRGAAIRLERARLNPAADMAKEAMLSPYWERYRAALSRRDRCNRAALDEFRWMIEEYRVSLFAQELRTPQPVSPKRLDAKWAEVGMVD